MVAITHQSRVRALRGLLVSALIMGVLDVGNVFAVDPVILIHGLWGGRTSWNAYADHLRDNGWSELCTIEFASGKSVPIIERPGGSSRIHVVNPRGNVGGWVAPAGSGCIPQVEKAFYRVVFTDASGQTLRMQGAQVGAAVNLVKQWTGASKVVLVGHSMGGLAARAYVQSIDAPKDPPDVAQLITVSTPHMGSLLPYLKSLREAKSCVALAEIAGKSVDSVAVRLLRPDSPELVALNTSEEGWKELPSGIAYVNVIATYEPDGDERGHCVKGRVDALALWAKDLADHLDVAKARSLVDPEVFSLASDGIVPVASQYLRAVPVGYSVPVSVYMTSASHTTVTSKADVFEFIDARLGTSGRSAGRR